MTEGFLVQHLECIEREGIKNGKNKSNGNSGSVRADGLAGDPGCAGVSDGRMQCG